jgi:hypothetical protein
MKLFKTLIALLMALSLQLSASGDEPLPKVAFESPYDLLIMVNRNAFPSNLDGTPRLSGTSSGITVSTCFMRDTSRTPAVWQASFSNRKQRKTLISLLNVPEQFAAQGVTDLDAKLQTRVRKALSPRLSTGLNTVERPQLRVECDEYWYERDFGAAETALRAGINRNSALIIPAFLVEPLINELAQYTPWTSPEKFTPDQYLIVARITFAELQADMREVQQAALTQLRLVEAYRESNTTTGGLKLGLLTLNRQQISPKVCAISSGDSGDEAIQIYLSTWQTDYRRRLKIALSESGDRRASLIDRDTPRDTLVPVSDLNTAFIRLTSASGCDGFVGSPAEIIELYDVLRVRPGTKLALAELGDIPDLLEQFSQRAGFDNYEQLRFARGIGATQKQFVALSKEGVQDQTSYESLKSDMVRSGYSASVDSEPDLESIFIYLSDRRSGRERGLSAVEERQRRLEDERRRAEILAAQRRTEQAEFDAAYPFELVLECGIGGKHLSISPCFIADTEAGSTQLELRTPEMYRMYQSFEVQQAGREIRGEGLKISVKAPFSIRVQNADKTLILTLKVRDKRTQQLLYTKSAAQYEVISFAF